MDTDFIVPSDLRAAVEADGGERAEWLAGLPAVVADLAARWSVVLDPPYEPGGHTAWVAPGVDDQGRAVALKVGWTHEEARDEAEGLAAFGGDGAVAVYAYERIGIDTTAMLLQRCQPGTELRTRPESEQHVVITDLLRRLWATPAPADHSFRPLSSMCDWWADEAQARADQGIGDLDPGLVRAGLGLFRELPRTADRTALLCTDLHAGNVLADTTGWRVIDPKPYVGDPHYDVLQHLLNCETSLFADPVGLLTHVAELADLDPDRVRQWLFARAVQESPTWPEMADLARRLA